MNEAGRVKSQVSIFEMREKLADAHPDAIQETVDPRGVRRTLRHPDREDIDLTPPYAHASDGKAAGKVER